MTLIRVVFYLSARASLQVIRHEHHEDPGSVTPKWNRTIIHVLSNTRVYLLFRICEKGSTLPALHIFGCGRKPERPEKTHTPRPRSEPRTFFLFFFAMRQQYAHTLKTFPQHSMRRGIPAEPPSNHSSVSEACATLRETDLAV